jgi:hypothetical protein
MCDASTAGFAESRSWFDPRNPIGPMLRIQGDAQLLKTLLIESLYEPMPHFQHNKSQVQDLIENDLHFQQRACTLATNSQSQ